MPWQSVNLLTEPNGLVGRVGKKKKKNSSAVSWKTRTCSRKREPFKRREAWRNCRLPLRPACLTPRSIVRVTIGDPYKRLLLFPTSWVVHFHENARALVACNTQLHWSQRSSLLLTLICVRLRLTGFYPTAERVIRISSPCFSYPL